ncbi:MAG: phosphate ABC transporter permease subunit PstC [Candidatus Methylomirabilales bacterium]
MVDRSQVTATGPGPRAIRISAPSLGAPGRLGDRIFKAIVVAGALLVVSLLLLLAYEMVRNAWLSLVQFGFSFVGTSSWDPVRAEFGALPFIYGTLISSLLALLLAVPPSIGVAIFLVELCPGWLQGPVAFLSELLAAIPSVVYGLWGIFILAPWMQRIVQPFLKSTLGFLPVFQGPAYGVGMLTAGIILAIMVTPFVSSVTREVLAQIPKAQREAALALGATQWEMIRMAVLPLGWSGIIGACMLGLGRALGETMAVTMVIGNRPEIALSLFAPSHTMASVIANEFTEATDDLYLSALIEIGLVLFIITLVVNILARFLVWRVGRGTAAGAAE